MSTSAAFVQDPAIPALDPAIEEKVKNCDTILVLLSNEKRRLGIELSFSDQIIQKMGSAISTSDDTVQEPTALVKYAIDLKKLAEEKIKNCDDLVQVVSDQKHQLSTMPTSVQDAAAPFVSLTDVKAQMEETLERYDKLICLLQDEKERLGAMVSTLKDPIQVEPTDPVEPTPIKPTVQDTAAQWAQERSEIEWQRFNVDLSDNLPVPASVQVN